MNVLLTCAGRRVYLVHHFRDALAGRGSVIAIDASPDAPAMIEADKAVVVPRISHPEYVDVLLRICREENVGLLLSLNDLELPIIARARDDIRAAGALPVISSPSVVETCFDKWRTFCYLREQNLCTPRTYDCLKDALSAIRHGQIAFPVVIKPRWGSASIGVEVVHDYDELHTAHGLAILRIMRTLLADASSTDREHCILIQECLQGTEYGLDVINDLEGNHITTLAKRKLAMRAGETERAVTVEDAELHAVGEQLGTALGHVGNLDCDVFYTPGELPLILELNPRFGGGYPFSHIAGADLPAALIAWAQGRAAQAEWLRVRPGVLGAKYDLLAARQMVEL